jgi:N-acetylglucosaminyldiphosphoundecaprenol N-acetyl-beta-D-mannosaminyltransferase
MVKVLGVELYEHGFTNAVEALLSKALLSTPPHNLCVSATGAHGMIEAHKNASFKKCLDDFHFNLPDGMPGVWIGRLKGAKQMSRCYGPDIFGAVMARSAQTPVTHFFCGGKEGVADELKRACLKKFNNDNIVGTFCPPFRFMADEEMKSLAETINASGANIVWIGLSTPKQEVFASRLAQYTHTRLIITVGAVFDFYTGNVKQAPRFLQRAGLEWLFRLAIEPRRLAGRYFEIVPKFIWLNIKEFVQFCTSKRTGK